MAPNRLTAVLLALMAVASVNCEKEKVSAIVGTTTTLKCKINTASCGTMHSIKWYKDDNRVYVYSQAADGAIDRAEGAMMERLTLSHEPNATVASLTISSIHAEDEGVFRCEITYLQVLEECNVVQVTELRTLIKPKSVDVITGDGKMLSSGTRIGPLLERDRLNLTCVVREGKPMPKVVWKFNGKERLDAQTTTPDNSTVLHTLTLTITRSELAAKLQCVVSSEALDDDIVHELSMDVKVSPNKIAISGVKDHAVQDSLLTLVCTVTGARPAARVVWFNGTDALSKEDHDIKTMEIASPDTTYETVSNFTFVATRFENGAKIRCQAENEVMTERGEPPVHANIELDVWYPPIVQISPANMTVMEGTKVLIKCEYESNPSSLTEVKWYLNDAPLATNNSHYSGGTVEQHSLIVVAARGEDAGRYRCELGNYVGKGGSPGECDVDVLFKPTVRLTMSSPSPILETDHANVTLTCEVVTGNPKELDEVLWFLDGELLKRLPECSGNSSDDLCNEVDPSMLLLQDTTRSFHGNYSCKGRNSAGWGEESNKTELVVYYPPGPAKLVASPWRAVKGRSLLLTCSFTEPGRPPATRVRWSRGGRVVADVVSAAWPIDPVSLDHRALFSCRAVSAAGAGEPATANVDVLAPPSFKYAMNHYSGALYKSQNISLSCTVECAPLCSVQWLKDGEVIDPELTHRYYIIERHIEPQINKNDFEATESTLYFNMSAWRGGRLERGADNARYTCRSSHNDAGPSVNSTTYFAVEFEPENITVTPKVVSVNENEVPEKVVCQAKGFPNPSYSWRRENPSKALAKDSTNTSLLLSTSNTLLLGAVQRKDAGNYVCEAYNRHGMISTAVLLDVMFIPECGIKQIELDGEQVLVCSAHANPSDVTFTWKLKNDNDTLTDEKIWSKDGNSYLRLSSAVDTYRTYLCQANNSVGVSRPCERDVVGTKVWWRDQQKLILIGGIALAILVITVILCIIIICVCRKMRAKSKYNNPVELEERENPDGSCLNEVSIAQSIISQALPALSPRLNISFGQYKSPDKTRLVDSQNYSMEMSKYSTPNSPVTSSLQANLSQLEATINAHKNKTEINNDENKQTKPQTVVTPNKWPLKPGVLVHVNSNHTLSPKNQARLQNISTEENNETPKDEEVNLGLLERKHHKDLNDNSVETSPIKDNNRKDNLKRNAQKVVSGLLKSLRGHDTDSDDDSGKYKKINRNKGFSVAKKSGYSLSKNRLKSFFQNETPSVVVTEGVVSFKKPEKIAALSVSVKPLTVDDVSPSKSDTSGTRKRKKPGDSPPTNGVGNANGHLGADNPGLYENLPFHGLQQAPNKPIQAIQPRVIETNEKSAKRIEAMQKQLTTNPSFTPRIVSCPPFVSNMSYSMTSPSSSYTSFGLPVLSPLQPVYPVHQTVLLNHYLPPMQSSYLKQFPTIEEEPETRKFASLNTRNYRKPPQFQSMRVVRKRNIERFYPNTEYSDNFHEINNNKDENNDRDEDVIYANCPAMLKSPNISGVKVFENLTDSIQVCEESLTNSNDSLNKPVPAPRTKVSPFSSPTKSDHIYVNMSMPLINLKRFSRSYDTVDAPIRPSKSAEDITKTKLTFLKDDIKSTTLKRLKSAKPNAIVEDEMENTDDTNEGDKKDTKPNIIAATPKRVPSLTLSSASLVKATVSKLNAESNKELNKVGLPRKQIITPNKTLQIPKLSEKPVPKKPLVRRSNSVQSHMTLSTDNKDYKNTNILQQQYLQKRNHFVNLNSKGKTKKNQNPIQKNHSFSYFQPVRVDKRITVDQERSYNNTIGPVYPDPQFYTKTLNRSRDKSHKANRLKKSESLREKLSCVGVYDTYEKPNFPQQYTEAETKSYLQLLKSNYISNSTRNLAPENSSQNYNTTGPCKDDKQKNKKVVYADLALSNHNVKFKNTVNSNRHLFDTYSINDERETNQYSNSMAGSQRKGSQSHQRSDYATLKFNEIDV